MKKHILALAIASSLSVPAMADVRINGFANLVGGMTSSDDRVKGYDDDLTFSEDSSFALQFSGDVNDKVSATAQFIARGNNDYEVDMEWAYMTYEVSDALSVSAGRLRVPLFAYSASLDVGYSYHWITPPESVYAVSFSNVDGMRVNYGGFSGDVEYNFQFATGNTSNDFELGGQTAHLEGKNALVFTAEAIYGGFKVRGVAAQAEITIDSPLLTPAFAQLSQISPSLSDLLAVREDRGAFYGIGLEYDAHDWFVMGEYTRVTLTDSFYPGEKNFYVTGGLRLGQWTPFATVESSDMNTDLKFLEKTAAFPAELQPAALQALAGTQLAVRSESYRYSLGVRYDVEANLALKAQVTRIDDRVNELDDAGLFRVGVNYVF
ncbi:porin [Aestuariibacter sp. AA17]|uniref:Porin n=1 Tax=Fluctibacter corallii TaxID=2984329 RepID=A0ABT3A3W7_9ALTE|nr:porin [Aestuariibacter sp. AA17]MCV2883386.1 porin [Aestuariibacter sp. AA17]